MSDPVIRLNAALEGRYRIERQLGEGGMATVYLADDLRHERKVALKVLKPELAAVVGAERFLAEIKTTANLQHPHILPLFDSGEADSFLFYVMPYVEGESLRERLDREKQLPVAEAVTVAVALANALDYAHRHGVIHRDIKPANILFQDGQPVVADFGIALAVGVAGGSRLTETGLSVGTPWYMSPEQATGDQEIGPPSDTYALAAVVYEMLTGDPPYMGSTAQAVLGQIIAGEAVSASKKRRSIPANVDAAIRKALEKLPADRFTGAQEFAKALTDPSFTYGAEAGLTPSATGGRLWKPLAIATSGLTLGLSAAVLWAVLQPEAPRWPVSRLVMSAVPSVPVVPSGGGSRDVVISPDGQDIVYQSGGDQLVVRALDELESPTLRGPDAARDPFFSPDGRWIGYQAGIGGPLQRVSITGGPPVTIAPLANDLRGASWGPDDMIVFAMTDFEGLRQVPASGGTPTSITDTGGNTVHFYPDVLPTGTGVLFEVNTNAGTTTDDQIAVLDLRTGEHRVLIEQGTSPRYLSGGYIVYAVGSTLMAVPFDAQSLEVTGEPVPVAEGVMVGTDGPANFSLSETGSLVYVSGSASGALAPRTLAWVDREGREEPLPLPPRPYQVPRVSPDGTRLAVGVTEASGTALWVFDVISAAGLRLTRDGSITTPVWTSGERLVFSSNVTGPNAIFSVMADGSAPPELVLSEDAIVGDYPTSVTPDGREVVFSHIVVGTQREIWRMPLEDGATAEPLLQGEFDRGNGEVSPDGRWLVYRSNQSGQMEVYVQPYPGPGPTVPVSIGGGQSVTWSPDGTELIYRLDDRMMAAPFSVEGGVPRVGRPIELFRGRYVTSAVNGAREYHVAPDGRFLMLKEVVDSGVEEAPPPQVVLVQNFFEELKNLVPTN